MSQILHSSTDQESVTSIFDEISHLILDDYQTSPLENINPSDYTGINESFQNNSNIIADQIINIAMGGESNKQTGSNTIADEIIDIAIGNEACDDSQVNSNGIIDDKINTNPKMFSCEKCGSTFTRKFNLLRHDKRNICKKPVEKKFTCIECDKEFSLFHNLKIHVKKKHPFNICIKCGQLYNMDSKHICQKQGKKCLAKVSTEKKKKDQIFFFSLP